MELPAKFKDIKTVEDVKAFFYHLIAVESVSFHPDDSFEGYINAAGADTYTPEEARERNDAMDRCHDICRAIDAGNGIPAPARGNSDLIYQIAIDMEAKWQAE